MGVDCVGCGVQIGWESMPDLLCEECRVKCGGVSHA